jgi:hypothetical protein
MFAFSVSRIISGLNLRSGNKGFKSEYQEKCMPLPERLYVPVVSERVYILDITKCDIKLGRYKKIAFCLYRAGGSYAIQCIK